MIRRLTLLTVAFAVPASAQRADQFDLLCTGKMAIVSSIQNSKKPYNYLRRIDLAAKKWCADGCDVIRDIAEIGPTLLTLEKTESGSFETHKKTLELVDRETGEHYASTTEGERDPIVITWEGTCVPRPFTGFPEFVTKF